MDLTEVPAQRLLRQVSAALGGSSALGDASSARSAGEAEDAARAAFWLLQAEMLGLRGFGIDMLLRDLERLRAQPRSATAGSPASSAVPSAASTAALTSPLTSASTPGAVLSIDASGLPGPLALAGAVRRAAEAADEHGVGLLGVRGTGALGVLGLAARSLALDGLVAVVAAQAPAMVAPWDGRAPAIGTNPLAFSAPRAGRSPLVADFATSRITMAELRERRGSGERLPEGAALDAAGEPTDDPANAAALLPAGRLGSLVGLFVEVLAGAATGGRVSEGGPSDGRGALVIAIDPERSGAGAGGGSVAESCARIADDWVEAGGHLPGRFDRLPAAADLLPETIAVPARSYEALLRLDLGGAA